jgi:membrane protein implicated in regulation of membrane protease activity
MTDRKSLSAYIAWISTCLLAAAAGHLIDDFTRVTWILLGAFGLVAAVGLQVASRTFASRQNQKLQRANQRRIERQLGHTEGVDAANIGTSGTVKTAIPEPFPDGIVERFQRK